MIDIKINRLENELRQLLQTANTNINLSTQFIKDSRISHKNFCLQISKDCTTEEIEIFDSTANKLESVINLNKHVFYKNFYVFVNRLKNVAVVQKMIN